jgi:hypothetical protein
MAPRARIAVAIAAFAAGTSAAAVTTAAGDTVLQGVLTAPVRAVQSVATSPDPVGGVVTVVTNAASPTVGAVQQTVGGVLGGNSPAPGGSAPSPAATSPAPASTPATSSAQSPGTAAAGPRAAPAHRPRTARRAAARRRSTRASTRAARRPATAPAGTASATRVVGRATTSRRAAPGMARASSSQGPVTRVVHDIVRVVPTPLLVAVFLLALLALAMAARSALARLHLRGVQEENTELHGDVTLLQRALLPDVAATWPGLDVTVAFRSADGPAAGGDFYDVVALDDARTAFIVGDACGHGRAAVAAAALARYTLRAYLMAGLEPRLVLRLASHALENDASSNLATAVIAVYDSESGTLTYACAGHEPPLMPGAGFEPVTVCSAGPLGSFVPTGQRQTTVSLDAGALVCLFTDGLSEARPGGEAMLGRAGVATTFAALGGAADAEALVGRIADRIEHAADDLSAIVMHARGHALARTRVEDVEVAPGRAELERLEAFLDACGVDADDRAALLAEVAEATAPLTVRVSIEPHAAAVATLCPSGDPALEVLVAASGGG